MDNEFDTETRVFPIGMQGASGEVGEGCRDGTNLTATTTNSDTNNGWKADTHTIPRTHTNSTL